MPFLRKIEPPATQSEPVRSPLTASIEALKTTNELLRASNAELQQENRLLRNEVSGLVQLIRSLVKQDEIERAAVAAGLGKSGTITQMLGATQT